MATQSHGCSSAWSPDNQGSAVTPYAFSGALPKYEFNVQGKVTAGERELDINQTMVVEVKDVGSTKIELPDEAKAALK